MWPYVYKINVYLVTVNCVKYIISYIIPDNDWKTCFHILQFGDQNHPNKLFIKPTLPLLNSMIIAPHHTWARYIALRYIDYMFYVNGPRMNLLCIVVTMHVKGYYYWFVTWYTLTTGVVATWDRWYLSVKLEQNYSTTIRCVHYSDVISSMMASQITSLAIVYSAVCSGADQRTNQCSASLAFVRGIHQWSGQ